MCGTTYRRNYRGELLHIVVSKLFSTKFQNSLFFCAKIDFSLDNHIQRNVLNVVLFYVVFTICMYYCDLCMFSNYVLFSSIIVKRKSI